MADQEEVEVGTEVPEVHKEPAAAPAAGSKTGHKAKKANRRKYVDDLGINISPYKSAMHAKERLKGVHVTREYSVIKATVMDAVAAALIKCAIKRSLSRRPKSTGKNMIVKQEDVLSAIKLFPQTFESCKLIGCKEDVSALSQTIRDDVMDSYKRKYRKKAKPADAAEEVPARKAKPSSSTKKTARKAGKKETKTKALSHPKRPSKGISKSKSKGKGEGKSKSKGKAGSGSSHKHKK